MRYFYSLLALIFLFSASAKSQDYTFRYSPYSGMNNDQLELALEQARKMERNGKVWTAVGTGMMVGGAVMTFRGIKEISLDEPFKFGSFGVGLGIMCFSGFPLGYGMVAWITGKEKANMIEIELLAFDSGTLKFKSTENGLGLVMTF
jgi:hypothetical protein